MWSRLWLIALAACYRPASAGRDGGAPSTDSADATAAAWTCADPVVVEMFPPSGLQCPIQWNVGTAGNAMMTQNNALVIQPDSTIAGSYGGCDINNLPIGPSAIVTVEVGDIIVANNAWTQVQLYSATDQWQIKAGGDHQLHYQNAASQDLGPSVPYLATYRWWRFRLAAATLYAEYFDGAAWHVVGTPQVVALGAQIAVEVNAGINNAGPYTGTGTFQTVVVCP